MLSRSRAAKRYAKALFDLAGDSGETDGIRRDIDKLIKLLDSMPDLSGFMRNYMLPGSSRRAAIEEIFSGTLRTLTFQFIMLLEEKKRCGILLQACAAFVDLHDRMLGIVKGSITTPIPPEQPDIAAITTYAQTKTGGSLQLATVVDPSIMGGFKLRLGDVVYDASVSAQLHSLKEKMIGV